MKKRERINGENIVYHIIQKQIIQAYDATNPPREVKFMIEQLLLWGGVWFKPQTYQQIPILLPYAVRDAEIAKRIYLSVQSDIDNINAHQNYSAALLHYCKFLILKIKVVK